MNTDAGAEAPLRIRMGFVVELAKRLHEYGTAAPRLEDVINLVSARLGLSCNVLSTPTSIVMSFSSLSGEDALAEITQVVRLPPGSVDLKRLCQIDEIADQVIDGRLDLSAGRLRLYAFRLSERAVHPAWEVVSYAVSAGSIAAILHAGWAGVATAALIGAMIGLVNFLSLRRPNISAASEAISALLATFIAIVVAAYVAPIAVRAVVIASLIVL
ncbi:MAG TPA: threonine/serine exporter family protein, partial [Rhodanobacteraceae bacterium]